jgi:hypothetical protein
MTKETLQVFSGSAITPEELLVLAEFAAPDRFDDYEHLREAAENLAEWTDGDSSTIAAALRLGHRRHVRPIVMELLRASAWVGSEEPFAQAS